jgi:hypothetical protein
MLYAVLADAVITKLTIKLEGGIGEKRNKVEGIGEGWIIGGGNGELL